MILYLVEALMEMSPEERKHYVNSVGCLAVLGFFFIILCYI